jgi:hypothetical protein
MGVECAEGEGLVQAAGRTLLVIVVVGALLVHRIAFFRP